MSEEHESETRNEFSHHLMNTGPIVETILKYLNSRQLNRCATVCQSWCKIVKALKSRRRTRSWTCLRLPTGTQDTVITPIVEDTKQFLQNLYTEPHIVFMMCDSEILLTTLGSPIANDSGHSGHFTSENYQEFVRSLLPKSCKLVGVGASGIVGTSADCKESYEIESESMGVSFLCLPKYNSVDISLIDDIEEDDDDACAKIQQSYDTLAQSPRQSCKVVLMLMSDFHAPRRYGIDLMKKMTGSLIAGAFVEDITPLNQNKFAFLRLVSIGGDNVQVASVIIDEQVDNAKDAEECVKKLKQCNLPEENSFALMFACLGRGEGLYREQNVEASLFRKHFPKTPLIGLFGNGEIGFEMDNRGQDVAPRSPVALYHSFTTILVLVSVT